MENIKSIYRDYKLIVDFFTEDKISSKIEFFLNSMNDFISSLNYEMDIFKQNQTDNVIKAEDILKINESVLTYCVMDYFTDIYRLKEFHNIELVNDLKRVSYESAWILRRKPIQILSDAIEHDNVTYINEKFVLSYISHELMRSFPYKNPTPIGYARFSSFIDNLFYYLKYRNCEPKVLELMMLSFEAGIGVSIQPDCTQCEKNQIQKVTVLA